MVECVEATQRGQAYPAINDSDFAVLPFPLPPLAEQSRIVKRVTELVKLCDQLETARSEYRRRHESLTASSLARLTTSNLASFGKDARFVLDFLPALTARAEQVPQFRRAVLDLAVQGKLLAQNPQDQPVSELRQLITLENGRLLSTRGMRAQKPALPAENFETSTTIPASWQHIYLQDLAYQITDGTHLTPKYVDAGKPFLSAQNIKPFRFLPQKHRFVSEVDFDNYRANRKPERGDILMTRVGAGIGEATVLDSDFEFAFYVSLCLIKIPNELLSADYLVIWLNSPQGRNNSTVRTYGKGASQGNLNLGLIRTFKIPVPPLAEQRRIVAKVDQLMTLCNQLEASLRMGEERRSGLLTAILGEALRPSEEHVQAA